MYISCFAVKIYILGWTHIGICNLGLCIIRIIHGIEY